MYCSLFQFLVISLPVGKELDANGKRMIVALVREGKYEGQYSGGIGAGGSKYSKIHFNA